MSNQFKCNIKEIEKYRDSLKIVRERFELIVITEVYDGKGKAAEAIEKDILQIETNKKRIIVNLEKYEKAITRLIDGLKCKVRFQNSEQFVTTQSIRQIRNNLNSANYKTNDYLSRLIEDRRSITRRSIENDGWGMTVPIEEDERAAALAMFDRNNDKFEFAGEKSKKIMRNIETLIGNFIREANKHVNVLNMDTNTILTDVLGFQSLSQLLGSFNLKSGDFYISSEELVELEDLKVNISKMSNDEIADKIGDWKNLSEEKKQVIVEYLYGLSKSEEQTRVLEIYSSFLIKYPNSRKNVDDICSQITNLVSFEIAKELMENDGKSDEEINRLVLIMKQNLELKEFLAGFNKTILVSINSFKNLEIKYDENGHLHVKYTLIIINNKEQIPQELPMNFDGTNSLIYNVFDAKNLIVNTTFKENFQTNPDYLKIVFICLSTIVGCLAPGGVAIAVTASLIDPIINIANELEKLTDKDIETVTIDLMTLCGFVKGNISNSPYISPATQYVFFKLMEDPEGDPPFAVAYKNYLQAINDPNYKKDPFEEYLIEFSKNATKLMTEFEEEIKWLKKNYF
ncbi:MAG: hypothetical protein ACRC5R_01660 [Mycoplasmatales bacterium]